MLRGRAGFKARPKPGAPLPSLCLFCPGPCLAILCRSQLGPVLPTGGHWAVIRRLFDVLIAGQRIGLPWWLSGKESACQCRRHGFGPWSGKIPQAMEQLRSCARTSGSVL